MPRAKTPPTPDPPKSMTALRQELRREEISLALNEARYMSKMLEGLTTTESREVVDMDTPGWQMISSGSGLSTESKELTGPGSVMDPRTLRRQSYRAWRRSPHGRNILRNFVKFVIGRDFKLDPADLQRGSWNRERTKIVMASDDSVDAPLAVMEVWKDFSKRMKFIRMAKELVLRTFRDGEMFLRKFEKGGRISVRFVEPDHVQSTVDAAGAVKEGDTADPMVSVGDATLIRMGIEFIKGDVQTVVAYHMLYPDGSSVRVPAKEIIHLKCIADGNDLRGFPILEPIFPNLTNYATWEEYRLVLNKVRSAVALVRKIDVGTNTQAAALIAGRQPARTQAMERSPQTESGRRETMFRSGTVLTPGPGVSYDFLSPKLEARDAGEDGRRFLLTIAAGVGQPEMLVTGDYANGNFASTKEAMLATQREWEDWQDFFAPAIEGTWEWVIDAAVEGLGLPEETDREVELQWPTIIPDDPEKSTNRRAILHDANILSKKTWAGQEGLVYDDEIENIREEDEAAREAFLDSGLDEFGNPPPEDDEPALDAQGNPLPPAGEGGGQPPKPAPGAPPRPPKPGVIPAKSTRPGAAFRRVQESMTALVELQEASELHPDPAARQALGRYLVTARRFLTEAGDAGMRVQALLFDKATFTPTQAKAWAKKHGYRASTVDVTSESVRVLQAPPGQFEVMRTIGFTDGIKAVVGR